jgi:polyhydroxyalkanoate synthesis regulator phasin
MQDAWRAYLEMALGLTEAPRKKAQRVAGDLVSRGGATAAQLQGLVEDLMSTGMANRESLINIVRFEVDRALGRVGLATAEEVQDLTSRVRDLEKQLKVAQARASAAEASATTGPGMGGDRVNKPAPLPAKKVAKKAPPNQMPAAATAPAKAALPKTSPAKTSPAKTAPAKAAAAKTAPAKKVAKKAVKSTPAAPTGTAEAPVAPVRDAAAATELPPVTKATPRKVAKKTVAKKTQPEADQ